MRRLMMIGVAVMAAGGAAAGEANVWAPLGEAAFPLPPYKMNMPDLVNGRLVWVPDLDAAVIQQPLMKHEQTYYVFSRTEGKWAAKAGKIEAGYVVDRDVTPQAYCYVPALKQILVLKQEWSYAKKKTPVASWLLDPVSGQWTRIEGDLSMSDRSADFLPARGRDGKRLPVWGTLCYDATNKEVVSFGGGGTWGRVGKAPEPITVGDWYYDAAAKRIRRLLEVSAPVTARRWYPGHCGTWTFAPEKKEWTALPQPLSQQPGGRILPGMAYDADEKKIVLFGGDDLARCLGDTWVYDCKTRTWTEVKPAVAPRARAAHAMVYVPDQKVVLLAGGYGGGWKPLSDVWVYRTATNEWTRLDLDLPKPTAYCSADYDAKAKQVVLAAFLRSRYNKAVPVYGLTLDVEAAKVRQSPPPSPSPIKGEGNSDDRSSGKEEGESDYHCKAFGGWSSLLPGEWPAGEADEAAMRKRLAALPANKWVRLKPPMTVPARGWGSYIYDIRTHRGFAWGGGHSTYPGAEISTFDLLANRWIGMGDATNYNPVWLHAMVGGPPGVSFGGWSLLPSHARKSYGVDPLTGTVVTYSGDVFDIKARRFAGKIGPFPVNWGGPSRQVAYVTTSHGLYGYACYRSPCLARANVAKGVWEMVAKTGPKNHREYAHLAYDSKRDRLVYFPPAQPVWIFDFKTGQWTQQPLADGAPGRALGDSTYVPEMDAVLMVFAQKRGGKENLYFYKPADNTWHVAPSEGDAFWRSNSTGKDYSPIYDPDLKIVVRLTPAGHRSMAVHVMRLDPETLALTKMQ